MLKMKFQKEKKTKLWMTLTCQIHCDEGRQNRLKYLWWRILPIKIFKMDFSIFLYVDIKLMIHRHIHKHRSTSFFFLTLYPSSIFHRIIFMAKFFHTQKNSREKSKMKNVNILVKRMRVSKVIWITFYRLILTKFNK